MNPAGKKEGKAPKKRESNCDTCEFYDYDEEYGENICVMKLDEDEMVNFLSGNTNYCPYYRFYDEYKSVQKQN